MNAWSTYLSDNQTWLSQIVGQIFVIEYLMPDIGSWRWLDRARRDVSVC